MNLVLPNIRIHYNKNIFFNATEVCESLIENTAAESVDENRDDKDIALAFDGM